MYHTLRQLKEMCVTSRKQQMFGRMSKTHITTIGCKVLDKGIPVPKNLLAFNNLATFNYHKALPLLLRKI